MSNSENLFVILLKKIPKDAFLYGSIEDFTNVRGRKVLLVSHELSLTGAPIALQNAAKVLLENGDCPVIAAPKDGRLRESLQNDGIPVLVDPSVNSLYSTAWLAYAELFDMVLLCTLVNTYAVKQLSNIGIPTLWWIHEAEESYNDEILNTAPYRLSDNIHVYCGGTYAKKKLIAHRPSYQAGVLKYNVIDITDEISAKQYIVSDINDKFVFAIVGTLLPRKGQDIFAKAIQIMKQADRERCRFVIIGKYVDSSNVVYREVQDVKKKYPKEVILINELGREEIADVYRQIDCMVCASRDDPMPVFITEAMMFSKICICSEYTGTAEIIRNGIDGFVYYKNSAEELAQKMTYVLNHSDELDEIRKNARISYENNFSYQAFYRGFLQIIDSICQQRGSITSQCKNTVITKNEVKIRKTLPLVSIIVPNYNHAPYLRQRLDSIYNQTYKNYEVILLDDCSTDESREILNDYVTRFPDNTRVYYNKENSGGVFRQWDKGIQLAKGELIWIAESDDWCTNYFLQELIPMFDYESVLLSFTRSVFMQDGKQIWTIEEYLHDLTDLHWDRPFYMTAHQLVNKGFAIKNIIPNASSAVFRNPLQLNENDKPLWEGMRLCGDWIFYLYIIRGGRVCYNPAATNYYRIHANSTSLNVQNTMRYYEEHKKVSEYVASNYRVDYSIFSKVLLNLEAHFLETRGIADASQLKKYYNTLKIADSAKLRQPNIAIGVFSMQFGGGETFPIYLANELYERGLTVTVIDFRLDKYDEKVRALLKPTIPLIEINDAETLAEQIEQFGIEIVHTHHSEADTLMAEIITKNNLNCRHIITTHGSYEAMPGGMAIKRLKKIASECQNYVYTAEKNLPIFALLPDKFLPEMFYKISNGLPKIEIIPESRKKYGIPADAFVLCLVSRAIPEKGWYEAVEAVKMANVKSPRPIHLLLIGEGQMYDELLNSVPPFVHLLGFRSNVRDFYAMSEMGFIPSRFKGESFPLVLIDSLFAGKPVLTSDIGEVRYQLMADNGEMAGVLFDLHDWTIPVEIVCDIIVKAANNNTFYEKICAFVPQAAKKFGMDGVGKEYLGVYRRALGWDSRDTENCANRLLDFPEYDITSFADIKSDETIDFTRVGKSDNNIRLYVDVPEALNGLVPIDRTDKVVSFVGWAAIPEPWRPMSGIWFVANGKSIKAANMTRNDLSQMGAGMSNAGFCVTFPTDFICNENMVKLVAAHWENDKRDLRYKNFEFYICED